MASASLYLFILSSAWESLSNMSDNSASVRLPRSTGITPPSSSPTASSPPSIASTTSCGTSGALSAASTATSCTSGFSTFSLRAFGASSTSGVWLTSGILPSLIKQFNYKSFNISANIPKKTIKKPIFAKRKNNILCELTFLQSFRSFWTAR